MIEQFRGGGHCEKVAKNGQKVLGSICIICRCMILVKIGVFWQSYAQIRPRVQEMLQKQISGYYVRTLHFASSTSLSILVVSKSAFYNYNFIIIIVSESCTEIYTLQSKHD
jgi:hypothetical protein